MIASILVLIFTILGGFHLYWVFGGKRGLKQSLPSDSEGIAVLKPGKFGTLVVAVILLSLSTFYLMHVGLIHLHLPKFLNENLGYIISVMFLLRAIGDFKYVGITKKIKNTEFAAYDTKLFTPLCLVIAILGILHEIL